jgi:MFS family permease
MNREKTVVVSGVFVTLCVMGAFAILSSTMSKSPVLNPFSVALGTPPEWSGWVSAASTIPGILVSLPVASLSDIYGRRKFLLLAGFVFASAPFMYLFIGIWWQLILVRFYHGFATAIFVPVAEASVAELFPRKKGERISLFTAATYVGRLVAPLLGAAILVATNSGIPYTNFNVLYLVVAAAGVTAFVMALLFFTERTQETIVSHEKPTSVVRHMFSGWRAIVLNRGAVIVSLVQACQYYAYGAFDFFLTGYLTVYLQYSILIPGFVGFCVILVALFVRPYMGRLSDRVGRRTPIMLGCLISALPLFVIPFITNFAILILLTTVYGFGFATVTAATSPLICEVMPEELTGTSMGFLDTTMDIGQTIGPIITGFVLASSLGYTGVFPSLAAVILFGGIIFAVSGVVGLKQETE